MGRHEAPDDGIWDDLAEDAINRATRVLTNGITIDILLTMFLVIFNAFQGADGWGSIDWAILSFMVIKTGLMTAGSYVMRRYLDRSRVPTPIPPHDQP